MVSDARFCCPLSAQLFVLAGAVSLVLAASYSEPGWAAASAAGRTVLLDFSDPLTNDNGVWACGLGGFFLSLVQVAQPLLCLALVQQLTTPAMCCR